MNIFIENIIKDKETTIFFEYNNFVIPTLLMEESFKVNKIYDVTIDIEDIKYIECIESQIYKLSYENEIYSITLKLEGILGENLFLMEFNSSKIMIEYELENPIKNKFYLIKFKKLLLFNNNL